MRPAFKRILLIALLAFAARYGFQRWYDTLSDFDKGQWSQRLGSYQKAIEHYNDALEADPYNLRIVCELASCFDSLGDRHTAGLLYREAKPLLDSPDGRALGWHRDRMRTLSQMGY